MAASAGGVVSPTWASRLAGALLDAFGAVPAEVLDKAALQLLDSLACASGAVDAPPVRAVRRAIGGSGAGEATVLFAGSRATVGDAVLANGTAVRYLDANDIFIGHGPGGHPSDNIPVALAAGEAAGASGRDVLAAIAVAYELTWRLRNHVFRVAPRGPDWHEVSISAPVAAAITALLHGADHDALTAALCIGAAKGYALRETRRGEITMLKACANALVAGDGVLAARLALAGMTGPALVFEGSSGLVTTLGGTPTEEMIALLSAPPKWVIRQVSIKPFPALGTSQAAIHAAIAVAAGGGPIVPGQVAKVTVTLPDSGWARDYRALGERRSPRTRETADHSIHFLVALALREGDVSPSHYAARRWEDEDVRSLMALTEIALEPPPPGEPLSFPATVEVLLHGGEVRRRRMVDTPGSPLQPWGREEILAKYARLDGTGRSDAARGAIADAVLALPRAPDLGAVVHLTAPA